MSVEVIYKDKNILALNKPAGVLVHGIYGKSGAKHNEETLVDWILKHYPEIKNVGDSSVGGIERAGIVHRLDRETSGVIVIARNQETFLFLKDLFKTKNIRKTYKALVWGRVKNISGVIDKPISIKDGTVRRTVFKGKMMREARTEYKVTGNYLYENQEVTLLEVSPKTGRTHQIRVHLNSIGHPVVGDKLYGKKEIPDNLTRHFLHADSLELKLRNGKAVKISADLPRELKDFLGNLSN